MKVRIFLLENLISATHQRSCDYSTVHKTWILISLEMQFYQDIKHYHNRSNVMWAGSCLNTNPRLMLNPINASPAHDVSNVIYWIMSCCLTRDYSTMQRENQITYFYTLLDIRGWAAKSHPVCYVTCWSKTQ